MTALSALLVLVLSGLIAGWGVAALVRRSRGTREPKQARAINWQSPVWNVVGVVAGVIGAVVGIAGLFK
jgi:hypothetical protein